MTAIEQIKGIFKAAIYLPWQAIILFSAIVAVPFLLVQFFVSITTTFDETKAVFVELGPIQERIKEKASDYFYQIKYSYKVQGADYLAIVDRGDHATKESAEFDYERFLRFHDPIKVWYNARNPNEIEFTNPRETWWMHLIGTSIVFAVGYYMKWLLLKYYELEIKEE